MDLTSLLERVGEPSVLAAGGFAIGVLFGVCAQRSAFCTRAAVGELVRGPGQQLAVWLLAFAAALVTVQALVLAGWIDVSGTRQLAARGSLSGAIVGGLVFGAGMVVARGCASRLLVLSASGSARAVLWAVVFALTAQAALAGVLAPAREAVSAWWTVEGGSTRDLLAVLHVGRWAGLVLGVLVMLAGAWVARRSGTGTGKCLAGLGIGAAVGLAWTFNARVAAASFQLVPVQGITFAGPSAEWLMRLAARPAPGINFDFGLLPGVLTGAFVGALAAGKLEPAGLQGGDGIRSTLVGAVMMGFGAMLAGGCAVGAGLSGGAIFSLTAWAALAAMIAGGALADRLLDRPAQRA
jgi:uncharacterized membrane protein YedE/YeeE